MKKQGQHILIVGPGYVGAKLIEVLSETGAQITAIGRSASDGITICDVSDSKKVSDLASYTKPVDAIVHCASSGRGGGEEAYRAVYLDGVRNLSDSFPEAPIIFTSSTSVYPQTDGSIVTEESPAEPDSPLAQILRTAEEHVLDHGGTVLRLSGIYGLGRAIHLQRILNETAIIESGEPSRWLNQIHRDDIVSAIIHLLDKGRGFYTQQIFNLSDDTPITQRECYEQLAAFFDLPCPPEAPRQASGKRAMTSKRISNTKLRDSGWLPKYSSLLDAVRDDPALTDSI